MSRSGRTGGRRDERPKAPEISRRSLFSGFAATAAAGLLAQARPKASPSPLPARKGKGPRVVIIGAGAFGGWTALSLLRRGARVTLVDAWGPGNSRASSGGETRVIRATYGPRGIYTHLAARALALWKAHERRWRRKLYHPIGVLWLVEDDDAYERAALPVLKDAGVGFEELTGTEAARRHPQISCERVRWAIFERDGGYLTARVACAAVVDAVLAAGGEYRQLAAEPAGPVEGGELRRGR